MPRRDPLTQKCGLAVTCRRGDDGQPLPGRLVQSLKQARTRDEPGVRKWNIEFGGDERANGVLYFFFPFAAAFARFSFTRNLTILLIRP